MKRNREARGGETDQQWLFHLGVFGFDLQTELQINATPWGKSKILMALNLYTLRWHRMNMWCSEMNGGEKSLFLKVQYIFRKTERRSVQVMPLHNRQHQQPQSMLFILNTLDDRNAAHIYENHKYIIHLTVTEYWHLCHVKPYCKHTWFNLFDYLSTRKISHHFKTVYRNKGCNLPLSSLLIFLVWINQSVVWSIKS